MSGEGVKRAVSAARTRLDTMLRPWRYDWGDVAVSFIVSTGRTGTQKLANLMSEAFHRVHARHEPFPDLFDIGMEHIRSGVTAERTCERIRRARAAMCREVRGAGADHYVESNNNLTLVLPLVRRVLPGCRIVHLVRNGKDFVRSAFSKTSPGAKGEGKALIMTDDDPRRRLRATDFQDDPYRERWEVMSRFERLCWLWVKLDRMIRDAIVDDARAVTVRFEDVFDVRSDLATWWEVVRFLGMEERLTVSHQRMREMMSVKENRTRSYLLPRWEDWPREQKRQFEAIAGEQMAQYGYEI